MGLFDNVELFDEEGRFRVLDSEVAQLGEEIYRRYVELRPMYAPGRVTVPRKQYVKFYHAALLCKKQQLNATQFVKQQLEGMSKTGNFWPSAIANPDYADSAEDLHVVALRQATHYKSQLHCFEEWAMIYGPHAALEDCTLQLTPLFRTVMANHYGFSDIVDEYTDAALLELEAVPIAREALAGHLGFLDGRRLQSRSHQHSSRSDDSQPSDTGVDEVGGHRWEPPDQ